MHGQISGVASTRVEDGLGLFFEVHDIRTRLSWGWLHSKPIADPLNTKELLDIPQAVFQSGHCVLRTEGWNNSAQSIQDAYAFGWTDAVCCDGCRKQEFEFDL